jgi:5-methyltetrahydrofolate--homocysteine methyltransferase
MKNNLMQLLDKKILVADGAMGTMLQAAGLSAGHCPEEWNVSHPEIIEGIQKAYIAAGSDIIETNTFGGNKYRLGFHGYGDSVINFNKKAAEVARSVCPDGKFVAGSVGPTGEFLEPLGDLTRKELSDAFKEQIDALLTGGVDILIIETMSDIGEACAAIDAAKNLNSDVPILATMTFEKHATGYRTMMGVQPTAMIKPLIDAGADVIGANCGTGMEDMIEIVREIRNQTQFPLLVQANAGLPEQKGNDIFYKESPRDRGQSVKHILQFGIHIIGGCCGTTPDHIKATRQAVDEFNAGE